MKTPSPGRIGLERGQLRVAWWMLVLLGTGLAGGPAVRAVQPANCLPVPEGLVAWWPGDGNAGDLGPHDLPGALLPGTAFGPGHVGSAFRTGGPGTGVRIPNSPWLRPTNLTVAAWIRSEGPAGYAYVVSKSYGGTRASYALYTTAGRQLAFYVETSGPTGWARSGLAPITLWDGRFHLAVGTYDNTRVRLYVDGEEIGSGENASGPPRYSSSFFGGDVFLGTYQPSTTGEHPFEGDLDEVALWNRALSADEIRALFAAGTSGLCRSRTTSYSLAGDFGIERGNPNGAWSYGWSPADFGEWHLYEHSGRAAVGTGGFWNRDPNDQPPIVWRNLSSESPWGVPPGAVALHPGGQGEASVVRWTAPDSGDAEVSGRFLPGDGAALDVAVRLNAQPWWQARDAGEFTLRTNLQAGATIEFSVSGGYFSGNTPVEATITLRSGAAASECLPSPPGLAHWWSGDGHARDLVTGAEGRPQGTATYGPGRVGDAFHFDGSGARVDLDLDAPEGPYTLEAWVYYAGDAWGRLGNGWSAILEFGEDQPTFGVRNTGELNLWPTIQGGSVSVKTWTHVAFSWDLSASRLFVNGTQVASTNLAPLTGGRGASLGWRNGDSPWLGAIDEVGVYDRALTPGEIAALHAVGALGRCKENVEPRRAPWITRQPANTVALADVTLSVEAMGSAPLAYQWFHDGQPLALATGPSLILPFSTLNAASGGTYHVVVTNAYGSTQSTPARLTVPPDLAITEVRAPAEALAGQTVEVAWNATNLGPGPVPASCLIQVLLASGPQDPNPAVLRRLTIPAPWDPAHSRPGTTRVTLPDDSRGERWIVVQADPVDAFPEPRETNNLASVPLRVVIPDRPDLALTRIDAPAQARPGQPFTVSWSVTNRGLAAATGPWTESLWLATAAGTAVPVAVFEATHSLPPLSETNRILTVLLPGDGPAGTLTVRLEADSGRELAEDDEANNLRDAPATTLVPAVLTLRLPGSAIPEDAPAPLPAWVVTRNGDRTAPLLVTLHSSNDGALTVPTSVTLPAGEASAAFVPEVHRDGWIDGDRVAWIEASAPGFEGASEPLTILEADRPRLTVTFPAGGVREGSTITGTVSRDAAFGAAWTIRLASSDPARLSVPDSVVLPAGAASIPFTAEAPDDSRIETSVSVTVTASAPGADSASARLPILDDDVPRVVLTLADSGVSESGGPAATAATFTRDPVTPHPVTLELTSSAPSVARLPEQAVIPARQASVTVAVAAIDNAALDGPREALLGGRVLAGDSSEAVATLEPVRLTVTDDDGPALALSILPGLVGEGQPTAATLRVARNSPSTEALAIRLASSDPALAALVPDAVIPPGSPHVDLAVSTAAADGTQGSRPVTFTATAPGHLPGSATLTVTDLALPDLAVQEVMAPAGAETDAEVELSYRIGNEGFAVAPTHVLTRVLLASEPGSVNASEVARHRFPGALPAGQSFARTLRVRLPSRPGEYRILVETDAEGAVGEAREDNNLRAGAAVLHVTAAYGARVDAAVAQALAGTPIGLSGTATNGAGAPVPFQPVHVHIGVRGTHRIVAAITDAEGRFEAVFQPLPREAGAYEVFATHPGVDSVPVQDRFDLLGLESEPASLDLSVFQGSTVTVPIRVSNPGLVALTGLRAVFEDLPDGVSGRAEWPAQPLAGGASAETTLAIEALPTSDLAIAEARLRIETAEGAILLVPVRIQVESARARWVALPAELEAGMRPGHPTILEFTLINRGGAASPPATLALPPAPWLQLATAETLTDPAPGATNRVTLVLNPSPDLPFGDYTGALVLNTDEPGLRIPFRFRCLSEATGDLRVEAEDEWTYFAEGAPRLAGAAVAVHDAVTGDLAREGVTDTNGIFEAGGLREGYYRISVSAPGHDPFEATRLLSAGRTESVSAFLRRQTVRYHWSVVPTEIEDRTRIVLETVFEASVPAPVVTVEPASIDLGTVDADTTQVDLTVTNHGLIAAEDVRIELPTDPDWRFEALVTDLGTLPARSALTLPVLIHRKKGGARPALASFGEPAVGDCVKAGSVCGQYWCGRWIRFCQPVVLQRLRGDCGSSGTMSFAELKFRGTWTPTQSGTVNVAGTAGGGWYTPPFHVLTPSTCQECIKVFTSVLTECSPEQIRNHEAGWYLVYNLACRGEAPPGFGVDDVLQEVYQQMKADCPAPDSILRPPPLRCFTLALVCPGWAQDTAAAPALASATTTDPGPGPDPTLPSPLHGRLTDRLPKSLGRQIPLAQALAERLDRVELGLDVLRVIFGDETWLTAAGAPGFDAWIADLVALLAPDSEAGTALGPAEQQRLLASPPPGSLPPGALDRLVARLRRTAEYQALGIRSAADLPAGFDPDFISRDALSNAVVRASLATQASRAEGFNHALDAANATYDELMLQLRSPGGGGGVCAQVRLRIEQEAVLTREAFQATLEIENSLETPLEDVSVELSVQDAEGRDTTERFALPPPVLDGLSAADGSGVVAPRTTSRARWTLVPGPEAAPTAPVDHAVGGVLRYRQGGVHVTVPLAAVAITVHPSPRLFVKYFHERDVFSDDPFTDPVEPAVPYSLAVLVENRGHGSARNLRIVSGQPRIIENEKGLWIDFRILATEVAGRGLAPSLTADFGTLTNGQVAIGRWLFVSTLQGLFTEYTAIFEHLDPRGLPSVSGSLIEAVSLHEMIRLVRAGGAFEDGLPDFLVNDVPDAGDLPDTLHLSDGRTPPVTPLLDAQTDGTPDDAHRTVTLTAAATPGWSYLRIPDPAAGRLSLVRVLRADGTEIPVGTNAWVTDRTFPGLGRRPIREHRLHLLDHDSPGRYTLEYAPADPIDTRAPESQVAILPGESPVQFAVEWDGDDEAGGSGLAAFEVQVSREGGPFTPWIRDTPRRSAVFTGEPGLTYAFRSLALDRAGNLENAPALPDATTRTSLLNRPPSYPVDFLVTVDEGDRVEVLLTAVDPDTGPGLGTLTYRLNPGSPAGARLEPDTGRLLWSTSEAHGPGTNSFSVVATDAGLPPLSATGAVRIVVREVNQPPGLPPLPDRTVAEGATLEFAARATDGDLPPNPLRYALGPGSPPGAAIDPLDGTFRWTPTEWQGPSTHRIEIQVSDGGDPPLGDVRSFQVTVRDTRPDFRLGLGRTQVFAGEADSVPITLDSSLDLQRIRFALEFEEGRLLDWAIPSTASEVLSASVVTDSPNRLTVELLLRTDPPRSGARELGRLRFTAPHSRGSGLFVLTPRDLETVRAGPGPVPRGEATSGRVIVVDEEPVLAADHEPGPVLRIFGRPGRHYVVESRPALGSGDTWTPRQHLLLTGQSADLPVLPPDGAPGFFRAREIPDGTLRVKGRSPEALTFEARVTPGRRYWIESTTALPAPGPWILESELTPQDAAVREFHRTPENERLRLFRVRGE